MSDVVVPALGESVTEAEVVTWLKKAGDAVAVDEPIVELETDKATVEVGAPVAGVLTELLVDEGSVVEVGAVLARVEAGGVAAAPSEPAAAASAQAAAPVPEALAPTPAADAEASLPAIDPDRIPRSGPDGSVSRDDLLGVLQTSGASAPAGPAAQKWMADHGVAEHEVAATGPGGRVTKGDVIRHVAEPAPSVAAEPAPAATAPVEAAAREERVRMPRIRQTIARRLKEAQETAAILTTFNEVDMSAVMSLRKRFKDDFEKKHGVRLGFNGFFAKAVVHAVSEVPAVNARIEDKEIVYHHYVNIGMAVSAPNGLVVPVIRDCDTRSLAGIEEELGRLAGLARDGELREDDMNGGTFTISNGGVFGSMLSTPILNRPQSGILGLHKIEERPVAIDGQVVIRPMMYLALSYDHRLIDGREAVTFLVKVKEAIEAPERLLLEV